MLLTATSGKIVARLHLGSYKAIRFRRRPSADFCSQWHTLHQMRAFAQQWSIACST